MGALAALELSPCRVYSKAALGRSLALARGVKNTDPQISRWRIKLSFYFRPEHSHKNRTKPPTKQEYQKHGRARTPARTVQYRGPPLLVTKNVARPLSRLRPHGGWPASTTSAPSRRASVCLCASFCCHACCACNHSRHLTPRHPSLGSRAASAPPQPGCGGCCWRPPPRGRRPVHDEVQGREGPVR